jgi:hypothetical protein
MTTYTAAQDARNTRKADRERALRLILALAAQGKNHRDIATALTAQGITPAQGLPGTPWVHTSVGFILRRELARNHDKRSAA